MKTYTDKNKIFWGLFFIVCAAALILSKMNLLPALNVFQIFATIIIVWAFFKGVIHHSFFVSIMSLALLACVYDKQLHITELTPWTILAAALLISIGLSLLFQKKRFPIHRGVPEKQNDMGVNDFSGEKIYLENTFGSSIKYINSNNFTNARISSSFGSMQVYFDNATMKDNAARIDIDVSFGNLILYIPSNWQLIDHTSASFGAIKEKNKNSPLPDAPVLHIYGDIAFAATEIQYI